MNGVGIVVQAAAFYMILEPVDRMLALLAAFARLAWAFTWMVVALNLFMMLRLLEGGQPALARLYLGGSDTYYVGLLFWSLAAAVGGYLFFKSKYIPRAGGVRHDRVGVVRRLHVGVLRVSRLREHREPLLFRFADGDLRAGAERLAPLQGTEALADTQRHSRTALSRAKLRHRVTWSSGN